MTGARQACRALSVRFVRDERGITMVEMLISVALMGVVLGGIVNVMVAGGRVQYNMASLLNAQQDARVALNRLEYEGRCATSATVANAGAQVSFVLPSQCMHATGNTSWCVSGGTLRRYTSSGCSGAAQIFARSLTSATPFSLHTATGDLPQLLVSLIVSPTGRGVDTFKIADAITLRNSSPS